MLGQEVIASTKFSRLACKWSRDQELHLNISKNRFSFSSAKCKKLSRSVHLQQEIKLEWPYSKVVLSLPARASEQGNVIGSLRICVCVQKKIVIERTRDLIYLKFVATDFFLKIISPSAGENSGDLA